MPITNLTTATLTATLNFGSAALVGVVSGDTVTLNTNGATVPLPVPQWHRQIRTVSGLASARRAANYTSPSHKPQQHHCQRPDRHRHERNNKAYDGTAAATLSFGSAALVRRRQRDTVTLNTTAPRVPSLLPQSVLPNRLP